MSWRVEIGEGARRELEGLQDDVAARLSEAIDDLQANPRPPGARKLSGREGWRIRKGDWRVLYVIDDATHRIRVYRIGNRRDVYRR